MDHVQLMTMVKTSQGEHGNVRENEGCWTCRGYAREKVTCQGKAGSLVLKISGKIMIFLKRELKVKS